MSHLSGVFGSPWWVFYVLFNSFEKVSDRFSNTEKNAVTFQSVFFLLKPSPPPQFSLSKKGKKTATLPALTSSAPVSDVNAVGAVT